jgi:hypothetical protein
MGCSLRLAIGTKHGGVRDGEREKSKVELKLCHTAQPTLVRDGHLQR